MAMFDIGKRGSGSELEQDQPGGSEPDAGQIGRVAPEREHVSSSGVRRREAAVIGPSIHIDGTLKGEEDLVIEGRVTGTVQLQDHGLTIGAKGHVEADLYAHTVMVEGVVEGNLYGADRVGVRSSAKVKGNITAPRVSLEDGAWFRGAIEMDPEAVEAALGTKSRSQRSPETTKVQSAVSAKETGSRETGSRETGSTSETGSSETAKRDAAGKAAESEQSERSAKTSGSQQASKGTATGH